MVISLSTMATLALNLICRLLGMRACTGFVSSCSEGGFVSLLSFAIAQNA